MRDAAKTLVLPFEKGALDVPATDDPFLFFDAEPLPGWEALTKAFQDHRGLVLDLQACGFEVEPAWDGTSGHAGALVLASRFREVSEMHVAQALTGTRPGGLVVVAANAGGAWSPIGDVTTTMLWIGGQISTGGILLTSFLPSLLCMVVPLAWLS